METSESKSISKTSKCPRCRQNRTPGMVCDKAWRKPVYYPCGDRCKVGVNIFQAFTRNRRTCRPDAKGEPQVATPQGESTDTGARVQELIDLKVCDVILSSSAIIMLTGKGNKIRRVPLMKNTVCLLESYISEADLNKPWKNEYPLFTNNQKNKLTREGVAHIISKYTSSARVISAIIPIKVKPHMFRHSKAMHLLQAGVNLIYIRDFLGHTDLKTTEIYAKNDTEAKRRAIENAYPSLIDSTLPDWNEDQSLLTWLSKL